MSHGNRIPEQEMKEGIEAEYRLPRDCLRELACHTKALEVGEPLNTCQMMVLPRLVGHVLWAQGCLGPSAIKSI